jgi:formylglycine-generating enzyme required for sulfatase activity
VVDGRGLRPAVQVTWDAARRYCESQGKRLPTEAEWEFAARGTARRMFPSGPTKPACDGAVHSRGSSARPACAGGAHAADVGTSGDKTQEGVLDLGGNVAEWVEDAFSPKYEACPDPCADPVSPRSNPKNERVVRGGYWDGAVEALRGAGRSRLAANGTKYNLGFRCAKSAKLDGT